MVGLIFVSVSDAVTIHRRMVDEFGGDSGLRDRGLLESALAMPKAMFGGDYLHMDLPSMAAAYHYHLCANHPFIDGNKRVEVAVAEVFLRANGLLLDATDDEIVELTLGVASGTIGKPEVTNFYAARVNSR
ncbi:MAG: type II toxin-antitoxin system death-on-curing family toxin [Gammaproteobacteria bacterium]|nr:type II toxin-antitoxin system death-on-curing family toxin [Gammaproteobacteria bacterium]